MTRATEIEKNMRDYINC